MNTKSVHRCLIAFSALLLNCSAGAQDVVSVVNTVSASHEKTGVRVVKATVDMPSGRSWLVENPFAVSDGVTETYAVSEQPENDVVGDGRRMAVMKDRREISARGSSLVSAYYGCRVFAEEHGGVGPKSLSELKKEWLQNDRMNGVHLIQAAVLLEKKPRDQGREPYWQRIESDELLLVDTRPAIDDGKHWVVTRGGKSKRVEIDPKLIDELGLTIVPAALPNAQRGAAKQHRQTVTILARVIGELPTQPLQLTLRSLPGDEAHQVIWDFADTAEAEPVVGQKIVAEWAEQRIWALDPALRSGAPMGGHWLWTLVHQYGLTDKVGDYFRSLFPRAANRNGGRNGRSATAMGLLGGRAAIDETLQLQNLNITSGEAQQKAEHPLSEIEGIKVEAHPFEEMLDGAEGGRIALADWIPADRLMVYLPKPEKIFSLLGGGSDFVFQAGSGVTGRSFSYQLKQRYLENFGFNEALLQRFLDSGAVEEMAVSLPDLFLIDGTDMSVVMRTGKPFLTNTALALIGVKPGDGTSVTKNARGEELHWFRRGSILIASTRKSEVAAMVEAADAGTSLGKSAELRYMLTQVPVTAETAAYGYISDPFIRRLVGPEIKIGQRRRLLARAELEGASAAALLAQYDGHGEKALDRNFLQSAGYLKDPRYVDDLSIDPQAVSHSEKFGRAAAMSTLEALPFDQVTESEKLAYQNYLTQYERYWRRFFDPIALRYEQRDGGEHELETFILPLINNSIYDWLREFLPQADAPQSLQVPVLDPPPIATLSLNLNEATWLKVLEDFYDTFEGVLGLDPVLLDLLGPDVHVSLQDADPIVTIGNGELAGMLGRVNGRNSGDFFGIQALVSILTRPTTVHIGLTDPKAAAQLLTEMAWAPGEHDSGFSGGFGEGSLYKVRGEERWIYRYSLEGLVSLRFSLEVQDRYLVINNQPFSNPVRVIGNRATSENAAGLVLNPSACEKQLPALFASAAENLRNNTVLGAACLTPLFQSDPAASELSVQQAAQRHLQLFGFLPQHPAGGEWKWDTKKGELTSNLYGATWQHHQPAYDAANDKIGLLSRVPQAHVEMRFEQDGLRSTIRWQVAK